MSSVFEQNQQKNYIFLFEEGQMIMNTMKTNAITKTTIKKTTKKHKYSDEEKPEDNAKDNLECKHKKNPKNNNKLLFIF